MNKRWSALLLTVALLFGAAPAQSATVTPVTFNLDYQVAGAAPTHWLTATFEDAGVGRVKLTMTAGDVPDMNGLKVTGWYFNVSDNSLLGDLTFRRAKDTQAAMLIGQYPNAFSRGFDLFFGFPSLFGNAFREGEKSVYFIRGEGLSADMFDLSNRDGLGRYFSMATASGPGIGRASLAAVPIPSAVWMLGAGLVGLVAIRRRNR